MGLPAARRWRRHLAGFGRYAFGWRVAVRLGECIVMQATTPIETDKELRDAVHALKPDSSVPDTRIKVSVRDGVIGLEWTVDSHYQRSAAEDAVRNIADVLSLNNHIRVKPVVLPIEVGEKIEAALRRIAEVDARRIHVVSYGAKVELHGNVRSWAEREDAQRAVWSAPGVADVVNYLTVTR